MLVLLGSGLELLTYSNRTTPIIELNLHFGPKYTPAKFHVQRLQCYCGIEISLIPRDRRTLPKNCNHLYGGPHYKDHSLQNHFLVCWHRQTDRQTNRQTDTLKTTPAFAITAGSFYDTNTLLHIYINSSRHKIYHTDQQ